MKPLYLLSALLAAIAAPLALAQQPAAPASATTMKIGYVNTERVLRDSAPALRALKKLEGEAQKREQELAKMADQLKRMQEDLEKNAVTMAESARRNREREFGDLNREFQRKQREFREDLNQRRNEELQQIVEMGNRVIRQIAEQEKFDIIFQDAVFASPRIDITDRVIKALEGKPPAK
jgi:outer membrane protein